MNPSSKASYDKINKYRQKIKQNIISQQNGLPAYIHVKEPMTPRQVENYPKMQSTLSRSNIRRNPTQNISFFRNTQESDDQNIGQQRSNKNRGFQQYSHMDQNKNYEQGKIVQNRASEQAWIQDQRTAQKPSTSKSPSNKNPYMQEREVMTKRKTTGAETERSQLKTGHRNYYQNSPSFQNPSAFQTFNQKPTLGSVLPPLFAPVSPSNTTGQQQVKILLQQNQIISLHLNQKMERIKMLERQLKAVAKSGILHEQKYDIEVSHLASENQMIKKSTDEQVKTLVMEVKKLNEEIVEKEDEWQERLNKVRKVGLEEQQEARKTQMAMEQRHNQELQELRIHIAMINQEFKTSKQSSSKAIQNLKAQNLSLTQSIQKLTHLHKMQKSQLAMAHDALLKQTKEDYFKKNQLNNLERIRKQNQLHSTIDQLTKEISKLTDQLSTLKHQKQFSQVKDMQQRGKFLIQLRQEKQKIEHLKHQESQKSQKLSKTQLQTAINSYQTQLEQHQQVITNLETLLQTRARDIAHLYKEISDTRASYQQQLAQRQQHVGQLTNKMQQLTEQNVEEQECLKIKLSELTHTNQQSIKEVYEKQLSGMKHLMIDKDEIIKSLRQQVSNQLLEMDENNLMHFQELQQLHMRIQKLQQQLTANALKQRNSNVSADKENIILKQNLLRQSQAYQKVTAVKQQSIKRLQKMIEKKDQEIEQLQNKLQLLKKSHKDQLSLIKEQYESKIKQLQDALTGLKVELQYSRKQQSKRAEQFSHDKQYYSNQLKELKNKGQQDFTQWVETLSHQINLLKMENHDLKHDLDQLAQEYQQYRALWNEKDTLQKIKQGEKQFIEKLNTNFAAKYQKLIQSNQRDIQQNYKPKINNLNQIIHQKDQQILDMKTNYHQLEMKFQNFMEEKETMHELNQKVLELGKNNSDMAGNYVTLGR